MSLYIGTSGYMYLHWKGKFYPKDLSIDKYFEYYITKFNTVEINNTFYVNPKLDTYKNWKKRATNKNFKYSIKVNKYITHIKRLRDPKDSWKKFYHRAKYLGSTLDVFLFQFPNNFLVNLKKLEVICKLLKNNRAAFEFRNESWYIPEMYELLRKYNIALVFQPKTKLKHISDKYFDPKNIKTNDITANYVYIRFHGPEEFGGSYGTQYLRQWAKFINKCIKFKLNVYVYFNNDIDAYAPYNAIELQRLI